MKLHLKLYKNAISFVVCSLPSVVGEKTKIEYPMRLLVILAISVIQANAKAQVYSLPGGTMRPKSCEIELLMKYSPHLKGED